MKNKVWLSLLILPILTGCGELPKKPTTPAKIETVQDKNAEILKNIKIELPQVTSGEYKTVGENGETYSDPNRIQLGDKSDNFLKQLKVKKN